MTCPAFRALATIARQLADLALFLAHPVAGWNTAADELYARAVRPRDGAERLADKEAGEEVSEPCPGNHSGCDGSFDSCYGCDEDGQLTRVGRQLKAVRDNAYDDDPIADCRVPETPEAFVDHDYVRPKLPGLIRASAPQANLDTVIALLEDVRNLLQLGGTFTSDDLMDAARAVDYFTRERFGNVERCGAWGRLATRLETAAETAPK